MVCGWTWTLTQGMASSGGGGPRCDDWCCRPGSRTVAAPSRWRHNWPSSNRSPRSNVWRARRRTDRRRPTRWPGSGLAAYFAGALLMPYRRFLAAAEEEAYDVDRLAGRFGVGFSDLPPGVRCNGRGRPASRSSSCASTVPATCRSASRRRFPFLPRRRLVSVVERLRSLRPPRRDRSPDRADAGTGVPICGSPAPFATRRNAGERRPRPSRSGSVATSPMPGGSSIRAASISTTRRPRPRSASAARSANAPDAPSAPSR